MARGVHGRGCAWQILRDTVNERAVHILLECILVSIYFQNAYCFNRRLNNVSKSPLNFCPEITYK